MCEEDFPSITELIWELKPARTFTKRAVKRLISHVEEVLNLAINSEDPVMAGRAISVFSSRNALLVSAASESNFFMTSFSDVLSAASDHFDRRVSAFATLCEICLLEFPGDLTTSFSFFNRFLLFTDNDSVLMMFKSLLEYRDSLRQLYKGLKEIHFVGRLTDRLEECRIANAPCENLFIIATRCASNCKLRSQCLTPQMFKLVSEIRDTDSDELLSAQWELICELCGTDTSLHFAHLFPVATDFIHSGSCNKTTVSALTFCTNMLRTHHGSTQTTDVPALARSLCRLCAKYSTSSILLDAATGLILAGIDCSETRSPFSTACLDFIAEKAKDNTNRVLSAFMTKCARRISALGEDDSELHAILSESDAFISVCENEVARFEAITQHDRAPLRQRRQIENIEDEFLIEDKLPRLLTSY